MNHEQEVYLTTYADDIKLISPNEDDLDLVSRQIAEHFDVKDLGDPNQQQSKSASVKAHTLANSPSISEWRTVALPPHQW